MNKYYAKDQGVNHEGMYQFVDLPTAYEDLYRYEHDWLTDFADDVYTILRNDKDPLGVLVYRTGESKRDWARWSKIKNRIIEQKGEDSSFTDEKGMSEYIYIRTGGRVFLRLYGEKRLNKSIVELIIRRVKGMDIIYEGWKTDNLRELFEKEYKRSEKYRLEKEREKENKRVLDLEANIVKYEEYLSADRVLTKEQEELRARELNEAFVYLAEKGVPTAVIKDWLYNKKVDIGDLESVKAQYEKLIQVLENLSIDVGSDLHNLKTAEQLLALYQWKNSDRHKQEEEIRKFIRTDIDKYFESQNEMEKIVKSIFNYDKNFKFSITRAYHKKNGTKVESYIRILFN